MANLRLKQTIKTLHAGRGIFFYQCDVYDEKKVPKRLKHYFDEVKESNEIKPEENKTGNK